MRNYLKELVRKNRGLSDEDIASIVEIGSRPEGAASSKETLKSVLSDRSKGDDWRVRHLISSGRLLSGVKSDVDSGNSMFVRDPRSNKFSREAMHTWFPKDVYERDYNYLGGGLEAIRKRPEEGISPEALEDLNTKTYKEVTLNKDLAKVLKELK